MAKSDDLEIMVLYVADCLDSGLDGDVFLVQAEDDEDGFSPGTLVEANDNEASIYLDYNGEDGHKRYKVTVTEV